MNASKTGQEAATGSGVLILVAILLISFLLFVTREGAQPQVAAHTRDLATEPQMAPPVTEEIMDPGTNSLTQTVRGQQVGYTLRLPPNWTTQSVAMDGVDNLSASCSNVNVAVMVQESKLGTSAEAAAAAVAFLKASATDFQSSKPERFDLDGRAWLKFVARCRIDQAATGYQYYVYSGVEGTYQIVAWTGLQNFEHELGLLRSIMQTFRFPRPDEPHAANTQTEPQAEPVTVLSRSAVP